MSTARERATARIGSLKGMYGAETDEELAVDVLTDVQHFCAECDALPFLSLLNTATEHFDAEFDELVHQPAGDPDRATFESGDDQPKTPGWTKEDDARAQAEGWAFYEVDGSRRFPNGTLEIERVDDEEKFESDLHAVLHVVSMAVRSGDTEDEPSDFYYRALAHWKAHGRPSYVDTMKFIVGSLPTY